MKITYLYHSGFAVDTGKHFLVFDYWKTSPKNGSLGNGVIKPEDLADRNVNVFSSHIHGDHFNKTILGWPEKIPSCRLILSDDIKAEAGGAVTKVGPGAKYDMGDFALSTLRSNDEGVAFVVDIDGFRVYHAGDLNWWHWEGEPGSWNDDIKESYRNEISKLGGDHIDLAFVPVDPRLGEQYSWGIDFLMKTADIARVVPMHFAGDPGVVTRLLDDPVSEGYRQKILALTKRGQSAEI